MKSFNSKGDVGHKHIKISSAQSDNKEILLYLTCTDKVINDNVSDSSNMCTDHLNVSFKGFSCRKREKDWCH